MRKTIVYVLLIVILLSLSGFKYNGRNKKVESISETGSAKYLDGKTILVSIFIEDKSASWTKNERNLVSNNLNLAIKYLQKEGKRYNKDVELIYNINEFSDLEYHFYYDKEYNPEWIDSDDKLLKARFHMDINDYIKEEIDSEAILKKYNADSIGYLFFIDGETDMAVTYPYYKDFGNNNYTEACVIPIRWSRNTNVEPASYAHEIIHLFGVPDLYMTSEDDGVTNEFIEHVRQKYPKDIMLGFLSDEMSYDKKITAEITDVTAYFLGWKSDFIGLEEYPSVKKEAPSVNVIKKVPGNYEGDKNPRREMTEEDKKVNRRNIIGGILLMVLGFWITTRAKPRKKNQSYDF